jgi:ABC-type uncharacterized transport system permease subunit
MTSAWPTGPAAVRARRLRRYWALGRIQHHTTMMYRANYVMNIAGVLLNVYLLRVVWTALYQDRDEVGGVGLPMMITYATFAALQGWLLVPWEFSLIPQRVREGKVAADLVRPVGFVTQVVAGQIGRTAATAPFVIATLPLAVLVGGGRPPASYGAAAGYLVSTALAYLIATMLSVVVGMTAFWTMEIAGAFMVYRVVSAFLSGGLVPLWFMPDPLRYVAEALPFQAMTYIPLGIFLGRIAGADIFGAVAIQVAWSVALVAGARLVWSRALHRVVVQGG